MKKLPDEEVRKTVMLMGSRKRKGRLESGALGPNIDPNPEVPLKMIIGMKQTTVPKSINMLDNGVTGVKTVGSIVMELESSPPPRPRSTPSSTPWPAPPDSDSEFGRQVRGRDTRPKERGTGLPLSQTRGEGVHPPQTQLVHLRGKSGAGTQGQRGGGQAHHRVRPLGVLHH